MVESTIEGEAKNALEDEDKGSDIELIMREGFFYCPTWLQRNKNAKIEASLLIK